MIDRLRNYILPGVLAVFLIFNIFIWYAVFQEGRSVLTVSFLNVGQGDAVFIETPSGNQLLIDAGGTASVLRELGKHMSFFDRTIDMVLMTHPDQDHIGGFPLVFDRFKILSVVESGVQGDTAVYENVMQKIELERALRIKAKRGMRVNLDRGITLDILFPDRSPVGMETNDASIVGKLVYGTSSFLLTGDAPKSVEEYLVSLDGERLESDVLKIGHHGSRTSTSETFLGFVHPSLAVISAGKDNRYGHPHKEVMDILEKFNIPILQTAEEKRITFISDGKTFQRK